MALIIRFEGRTEQAIRFLAKHGEFGGADPILSTTRAVLGLGFYELLDSAWATEAEMEAAKTCNYTDIEVLVDTAPDTETHEFDSRLRDGVANTEPVEPTEPGIHDPDND